MVFNWLATLAGRLIASAELIGVAPRRVTITRLGLPDDQLPDLERLLVAERHLQHLVPGTILVGGTAAAVHAGHPVSMDGDVHWRVHERRIAGNFACPLKNRTGPDLESDEVLAQILDRGEMSAWRELSRLARTDAQLRARIEHMVLTVPVPNVSQNGALAR